MPSIETMQLVEKENRVGTYKAKVKDSHTGVSCEVRRNKYADLFIPGGVLPGVSQQSLDFKAARRIVKVATTGVCNREIQRGATALKESN